jgi:hypothetical protein
LKAKKEELVKFNENVLPNNFVSIAAKIVKNKATHAALLIRYQNVNYLYHYPGNSKPTVIKNFNEAGWYIYKIWENVKVDNESEVGSFLSHCFRVCEKSNITYSFTLDNSIYDHDGTHQTNTELPELGTCVGFCVNTLNNHIYTTEEGYFKIDEWDDYGIPENQKMTILEDLTNNHPDINWAEYDAYNKRISPLEFLSSSFYNKYPITKQQIAEIQDEVQAIINEKFLIQ